ncbi:Hypothetical protein PHPALM_37241 [Phytophthora palmivora]|uniref:RxLR effector n=1 Tax=Phytophthora palmivora TaxID=4796 RepID=A0A2P4WXW9_9STRA|nr:Hypothetical protein PHPALM_37241 [Phytophthora palmivora]
MRLIETIAAMAAILLVSCDNVTADTKSKAGAKLYAEIYRVENGSVTEKVRVPLGDVDQYKQSDLKTLKKSIRASEEERDMGNTGDFMAYGPILGVVDGIKALVVKDPSIGVTLAKGTLGLNE